MLAKEYESSLEFRVSPNSPRVARFLKGLHGLQVCRSASSEKGGIAKQSQKRTTVYKQNTLKKPLANNTFSPASLQTSTKQKAPCHTQKQSHASIRVIQHRLLQVLLQQAPMHCIFESRGAPPLDKHVLRRIRLIQVVHEFLHLPPTGASVDSRSVVVSLAGPLEHLLAEGIRRQRVFALPTCDSEFSVELVSIRAERNL